jgi:cytoplasmic iron level regulating protein YaaA (DUF328/UPF0246 family)
MLYLLSPAKSLDYDTPVAPEVAARATTPQFVARSAELIEALRPRSAAQIASLMSLSTPLAELNVARYAAWSRRFTARNSKPAALAFNGDVYEGLRAATLDTDDLAWAQDHVVILSGLYGVLRPLDKLQPYRLEMGTPLATAQGKDLYAFWGDTIAQHLNRQAPRQAAVRAAPVIVNLASHEYARAALRKSLKPRVIECVFEDWKSGHYKVISFFAKRARGLMARHAIQHRIDDPAGLLQFRAEGYRYAAKVSEPDRLVFRRRIDQEE